MMTLLDLPKELLIKIIEDENISMKDRLSLRRTCRDMETFVAASDYKNAPYHPKSSGPDFTVAVKSTLISDSNGSRIKYETTIQGLLQENNTNQDGIFSNKTLMIPASRHDEFIHFFGRVCHRAHFDKVKLNMLNYRPDAPEGYMSAVQLIRMAEHLKCNQLWVNTRTPDFDPCMMDVIRALKPEKGLSLDWQLRRNENLAPVHLDVHHFANLPDVPSLSITSDQQISEPTILALISKYPSLNIALDINSMRLLPDTLTKASKIVGQRSHWVEMFIDFDSLIENLRCLGLTWSEWKLSSSDPSIKVIANRLTRKKGDGSHFEAVDLYYYDYIIEVNGTIISFRLFDDPAHNAIGVNVDIGRQSDVLIS